jgi:hypothetical protein
MSFSADLADRESSSIWEKGMTTTSGENAMADLIGRKAEISDIQNAFENEVSTNSSILAAIKNALKQKIWPVYLSDQVGQAAGSLIVAIVRRFPKDYSHTQSDETKSAGGLVGMYRESLMKEEASMRAKEVKGTAEAFARAGGMTAATIGASLGVVVAGPAGAVVGGALGLGIGSATGWAVGSSIGKSEAKKSKEETGL